MRAAFGSRVVFQNLDCRFEAGEISVVMGGSGAGKSTLLRMIGGLLAPSSGSVRVGGQEVVGLGDDGLNEVRRRIGMLFQNGALLDALSVFDNVALPLREHSELSDSEITTAVHSHLEAVGLSDVDALLPGELSGGMMRRAALARAIVMDPQILLCDEPFSGLDPPNVARIEALLTRLNRELGLTVIVASHHTATSLRMAHRLFLLRDGGAVSGSPKILAASGDSSIADFLGPDGEAFARVTEAGGGG